MDDYGWHYGNSNETTHPVGQKSPNPWGLYDMYGNACEWVLDGMLEDGYAKFNGKRVSTSAALVKTKELFPRVVRGGYYDLDPQDCRSASRFPSSDDEWRGRLFSTDFLLMTTCNGLSTLAASLMLEYTEVTLREGIQLFAFLQVLSGIVWVVLMLPKERLFLKENQESMGTNP